MRWFRDHPKIGISIVAVLILLILFYASLLSVGKNNFMGRTLGVAIVQIQKPFTFIGNAISGKVGSFTSAGNTEKENEKLKAQVTELRQELATAKLNRSELQELQQLSKAFNSKKAMTSLKPVAAEMISYDGSGLFNIFTVNAGSDSGVKVNDAVINENGLIGRVLSVGSNWCKIISIIDESNNISFQMSANSGFRGVAHGNGKDGLAGYFFNAGVAAKPGDELVTSGIGGVYPAGLIIGTINTVDTNKDNPLKNITVKPAVDFKSINRVAILTAGVNVTGGVAVQ